MTTEVDVDHPDASEGRSRFAAFLPSTARQWLAMLAALLFLAGAVGYFIGTRGIGGRPGPDSVDVGFLQDMISHHEQAIAMAMIEITAGTEPGIQVFAREILYFQAYEIGLMERKLGEWGYEREERSETAMEWMDMPLPVDDMPGLASEEEMHVLGDSTGRDVDALFVPLMQDHHRGGVHMAAYAAQNAADPFVRDLAARMARNQRIEVGELEAARDRVGLPANPVGYEPAVVPTDHEGHS